MFQIIGLIIDAAWALAMFALRYLLIYLIGAGILYGLYWIYLEFAGRWWAIDISISVVILIVIAAIRPDPESKN